MRGSETRWRNWSVKNLFPISSVMFRSAGSKKETRFWHFDLASPRYHFEDERFDRTCTYNTTFLILIFRPRSRCLSQEEKGIRYSYVRIRMHMARGKLKFDVSSLSEECDSFFHFPSDPLRFFAEPFFYLIWRIQSFRRRHLILLGLGSAL